MPHLALIDISGIQAYLYGSPELQEIAGASERIEALARPGGLFQSAAESSGAELIVAAGGNASFRASDPKHLQQTVRAITRELLTGFAGLDAVSLIAEYADDGRSLAAAYRRAVLALDERKRSQPRNATFRFSGLLPEGSPETGTVPRPDRNRLAEPRLIDYVICAGDVEQTNLMGVVSVDGLGMGRKFIAWLDSAASQLDDETFVAEFRAWSGDVKRRWSAAWDAVLAHVAEAFAHGYRGLSISGDGERLIRLKRDDSGLDYYPMRRIYQGGDDLSFVCDARIALSATAILVDALESAPSEGEAVPKGFRELRASAGVVFVESHFPFFRAATLADAVRREAKEAAARTGNTHSMMTWWLNRQGALSAGDQKVFNGRARLRPYALGGSAPPDHASWSWMDETVLPGLRALYAGKRNKLKDLLAALDETDPQEAVKRLLELRPLDGAAATRPFGFLGGSYFAESGFNAEGGSPLYDAAEIYDIHYALTASPEAKV